MRLSKLLYLAGSRQPEKMSIYQALNPELQVFVHDVCNEAYNGLGVFGLHV